jgi:hypothetical protein
MYVGQLLLTDGGRVSVSTLPLAAAASPGAGHLTIRATASVVIDGQGRTEESGLFGRTTAPSQLPGLLKVSAPTIELLGGGQIRTETSGSGPTGQTGQAAHIDLRATRLAITGKDSGAFSATTGSGSVGNMAIRVQQLQLMDGGTISASTRANTTGNAGQIRITAADHITISGQANASRSEIRADTEGVG